MKNLLYLLSSIALFTMFSCEGSLDDDLDQIRQNAEPEVEQYQYTISSDDYSAIVPSNDEDFYDENERFESEEDALERIPIILLDHFVGNNGDKVEALFNIISEEEETLGKTIESSLKFKYDAISGTFIEDAATPYVLVREDYIFVANDNTLNDDDSFDNQISNLARFYNFNRAPGNTSEWSEEQIEAALAIVLTEKYPEAEEESLYEVTYSIYNGSSSVDELRTLQFIDGEFAFAELEEE